MASLATNFAASCFLFPVGLKRLFSSSSLYLTNPSIYRSKPWYFSSQFKYLNFDFYILLIALPISSLSELFLFFAFSGGHQTYRFAFSQQSLTLFLFWLLLILIALREQQIWASRIDQNFVFLFGGIVFLIEYSFNGRGISGVGVAGAVYELLGKLSLVCVGSCLYLAVKPTDFWAEFTLSCGLIMKGTWIFQAGLSLGSDAFSMNGCGKLKILAGQEDADVKCDLDEDALRGVALMNLLFVGHAILVLVLSLVLFGFSSFKRSSTFGDATGPLLETNNRVVVSIPPPEYQLE